MKQSGCVKPETLLGRNDRKASQGFVDIKSLTVGQLDELIERQNKLLENRYFLQKLPDRGKKILSFKAELEVELKKKQEECDAPCQLLFNLSLCDKNTEHIEWNKGELSICDKELDSDDDDDDDDDDEDRQTMMSLKYVATHSGTANGKKIGLNSPENKFNDPNVVKKNLYVDKCCEKYEKSNKISFKERFKPNRLRNGDKTLFITSAQKVKERLGNKWEVTEATPPAPIYKDAVLISLTESLKLQKDQAEKLKEIEKKNTTEKLLQNMSLKIGGKLPVVNVTEYRSTKNDLEEGEMKNCFEVNEFRDSDCDDEENDEGSQPSRKPQTPQLARKTTTSNGLLVNECLKEGNSTPKNQDAKETFRIVLLPKTEELNEKRKRENVLGVAPGRRPSTFSGEFRRKTVGEKERSPTIPTSKSFSAQSKTNSFDRRSIGSAGSKMPSTYSKVKKQSLSKNRGKSPAKSHYRIDCAEDFESTSLFPQAVYEHGQVIEMLCAAREDLKQKMLEKIKANAEAETNSAECFSLELPNSINFENSYRGTLEEIFQAWVNLFYFIINLKINLIRVLNLAGTEPFRPNPEVEREIVGQAIECVKFFSKLKIKSIVNSFEEFRLPDGCNTNEIQIKDCEERVSSPFVFEMNFIQKKAREILEQTKKGKKLQLHK